MKIHSHYVATKKSMSDSHLDFGSNFFPEIQWEDSIQVNMLLLLEAYLSSVRLLHVSFFDGKTGSPITHVVGE